MAAPSLDSLSKWAPFQLDALGLITIFGAKEMNTSIGTLVHSWVTDWLPVLGSYAVANNEIAHAEQGFVLYNITDGIMATDVAAWFTRWLMSFPPTYTATTITLKTDGRPMLAVQRTFALAIGLGVMGLSLSLSIVTGNGWDISNSVAMCLLVLVRQQMVGQLRTSIDRTITALENDPGDHVKVFLTLPNGRAVTILSPRQLVVACILTDPRPVNPRYYYLLRIACWALFGAHAIALGMSNLFNQIITVVLLLVGTFLTAMHAGACRESIGTKLRLKVDLGDPTWNRSPAYARLNMSPAEEDCMVHWNMMPQRSNAYWWNRYNEQHVITRSQSGSQLPDTASESDSTKGKANGAVEVKRHSVSPC